MYPVSSVRNQNYNAAASLVAYGPYYPAHVTGDTETGIDWFDPGNAQGAENEAYASCDLYSAANSAPLCASDFGMSIPATGSISGIKVEVLRKATSSDIFDWAGSGHGARLLLDGDDSGTHIGDDLGDNDAPWPDNFEWTTYGGERNLWGTSSLTAGDLNSSSFAFETSVLTDVGGYVAMVDAIRITVYIVPSV